MAGDWPIIPIIAILRSFFNIQEGEDDLRVKSKVQKGLEILGVEGKRHPPLPAGVSFGQGQRS